MPALTGITIREPRSETRIFLILMWAVALFSLYMSAGANSLSTDDAMRLVEVRDFLAGQGWFDLTQYRLNPPTGVETHWSRLIDLPLALIIEAGSMFVKTAVAERVALIIWPSALLLVFLAGVSRLACELAGHVAARVALVFSVLMAPVLQHFRTGAIDHHNAQLALTIWSIAFFARQPSRPRDAAVAGGLCALSVAIGQEMVPAVAALAVTVGLRWAVEGKPCKHTTIAYAVALAAGSLILALATVAPAKYLTVDCDALSIAQVGALGLGGFGLAALAMMPRLDSFFGRTIAATGLAALLAAALKFGAPQCLGDPYASLDPRLIDLWLSSVSEGRNIYSLLRDLPQQIPVYFGVPLAALMLGACCCVRVTGPQRWNWIACTATQAVFIVLATWEVRVAAGANAVAALLLPASLLQMLPVAEGRASYLGVPRPALLVMLLLNPLALLALGSGAARAFEPASLGAQRIINAGDVGTCIRAADYVPLATLPRGRVLAFIDAGPFILMQSEHAVLAAPYHRDAAGNLAMLDMFLATPQDAKRQLAAHDISYVAFCPGAPERYTYAGAARDGLAAALANNNVPDFLQRIPFTGTDLVVYRVVR
jgi:hypothetical protein